MCRAVKGTKICSVPRIFKTTRKLFMCAKGKHKTKRNISPGSPSNIPWIRGSKTKPRRPKSKKPSAGGARSFFAFFVGEPLIQGTSNKSAETIFLIVESKNLSITSIGNSSFRCNLQCQVLTYILHYKSKTFYSKSLKRTSFTTLFDGSTIKIYCIDTVCKERLKSCQWHFW